MVARLVIDVVWRNRWGYALVCPTLVVGWLMYMAGGREVLSISLPAVSLICVAVLGPLLTMATMGLRELRHLPITNRDLWRATWIVAVVVAPGLLLATKTITALLVTLSGGRPKVPVETMMLSAVYDVAWAGVLLPLFQWLRYGSIGAMLACFGLPILASGALPTHIGEVTSATTGVLIGCLAIAFGALAWTPQRSTLAAERAQAPAKLQRRHVDRLTGISRVVVPHLAATLALPAGACLALAAYGVISGSGPWWFMPQVPSVFDPADIGDRGLTYFVLLPGAVVTMQGLWTPWARLLKVLPLSVRQINALLLLTPFATWAMLWLFGWCAYAFAYGRPRILGVVFAFGMAALGALAHAALLRVQGSTAFVWTLAFIGGLMPQMVKVGLRGGTTAQVVFAVIGATALCTAAFINHRTLTRATSASGAYRRPQSPFGVPATPGIR